jgi:hypothetical protein
MKDFTGVIIEESLHDTGVLKKVKILKTKVEEVTEKHQTPHLKKWTLHTVEIPENKADEIAKELSQSLLSKWYADFKNASYHYIVFRNKIFKINRSRKEEYDSVAEYGISIGIPDYQLDFSPHVKEWKR